jgi:hypothetical protein
MVPLSRSSVAVLLATTLVLPIPLHGQSAETARPGTPVRFAGGCGVPVCPVTRASLLGATADSIVFTVRDRPLALARSDLQSLEIGHNRHGVRTGAIIGAGVLGLGTAALAVYVCAIDPWDDDGCPAGAVAVTTLASAGVGAGLGALVGAVVAPMQWRPVSPEVLRMTILPLSGARTGIGLSIPIGASR